MKPNVSVVIPAYNEVKTIGSLTQVVLSWPVASQVIVINDGSTDATDGQVSRFGDSVDYIKFTHNKGQGAALAVGIVKAKYNIILCIDADVSSITHKDLDALIEPVVKNRADMAIGVLNYWKAGSIEPFNDISGTRVFLRKNVINATPEIEASKYGVTVCLNGLHKSLRVVSVRLPYTYVLGKFEKQSVPAAMQAYVKEASELLMQAMKYQVNGRLTPPTKRIFASVQSYLAKALEFIQSNG